MQESAQKTTGRWGRLRPRDPGDWGLVAAMAVGLVLYWVSLFIQPPAGLGPWRLVLDAFLMSHGSTPLLFFLALAVYLVRWGRTLGNHKVWVWVGLVLTVPLWFLAGLPVAVRGAGDITLFFIFWNLIAFGLMGIGTRRTLGPMREERKEQSSR